WAAIAERYKGNATVAFYELYNEPTVSGENFGKMTWPEWKEIQEGLIAHIRRIDSETIILVAGFDWAYDLTWVGDDPFTEANIAYVSHPYPQKRDEPWEEKWEADWGYVSDKYPVILTEVGFCLEEEKGAHVPVISTEKYGIDLTSYTERKGISWVAWVFDVNWSPQLITDWDFTPSTQGRFFKGYLQSKRKQ
ncbi:MAG: cellulase family glycosylhydrolase, partial [Acidobacteriota bacterium]